MDKARVAVVIIFILAAVSARAEAPLPDISQVTKHLDNLYRADSSQALLTMSVKTKYFSRTLEIESWTVGDKQALMVIRKPARESGTATLRTRDGLWNYAPRADRLVRIPTSLLSESWMGSHFTNDDLVRDTSFLDDFIATLAWSNIRGKVFLVVTLTPKPSAPVVYTKVVFTLQGEDWLPVRTDWYDGSEIVRKTQYSDVKTFGNKRLPATLTVIPSDKPSEYTAITYKTLDFTTTPPQSLFTPSGLKRAARRR